MAEYRVTVNCLVSWFPTDAESTQTSPILRSATFTHLSSDVARAHEHRLYDSVRFSDLSIYGPNCDVTFSVDGGLFMANIRLELFGETRTEDMVLQPSSRVPFLLQTHQGNNSLSATPIVGTTGVFQGVISTDSIVKPSAGSHIAHLPK